MTLQELLQRRTLLREELRELQSQINTAREAARIERRRLVAGMDTPPKRQTNKDRLKLWLLANPEALRQWRDAPDDPPSFRVLCDLVCEAGIYSNKSIVPIGSAICELLETMSKAKLFGESDEAQA